MSEKCKHGVSAENQCLDCAVYDHSPLLRSFAASTGYDALQVLEIFCECQRNVDNAVCAMKAADFGYAEVQLKVALEKVQFLRAQSH